ncbi:F-box-like/WD repeat-containing protein TBL1XR1 [Auxenochlorella protothecoides]|uniref:F-box-like/WD repeat-containing protein TBL1XR1 n=1 Tax=Auxenochlorella protothecoides TaxID=3075 RepID=A0A087SNV3_AUXPR|nr:F-box-like/WD repeat-containing protein TBL1XR1 [Auxenochlorella protothecoides]KFM27407.1 F-box-like/WD repeat-containing protein TBL1XR1 [Auxenochlorella protothecoides]RMZ54205.1 hypothetical protein APUTEX25_005361 [Auxenochlorella protothecoides]|eukprot:RMZ54205.1 hypothetical protein APUTEX25_005361 [Auxenochlorella protothecoides]
MALTSDHVNFLVYRYLLEAGFAHTAFTFGAESSILNSGLPGADVPVGTLVSILQKGFQFAELEANLTEESTDVFGEFTPLSAEAIMTGDVEELRATVREWHEKRDAAALDVLASGPEELDPGACLGLGGAEGPVYACPWAPAGPPRLAAGSADGSLRLWDFPEGTREPPPAPCVCATGGEITAIEWSPGSSLLAVALMDGSIQIWEADGTRKFTLEGHTRSIFALRWNRRGDLLLSCSVDCAAIVWDARTGALRSRCVHHAAPLLDGDWRTNAIYATASADRTIAVFRVGEDRPLKVWKGHSGDINGVRWDGSGKLLASASDDGTVRIWSLTSDAPLHTLTGHSAEVNSLRWGPWDSRHLLASAGADGLVQIFDPDTGTVVHRLDRHGANVPHLRWSPAGEYLATGDELGQVLVWSTKSGAVVRSLQCPALIHDLSWAPDGETLSMCMAEGAPQVLVVPLGQVPPLPPADPKPMSP